MQLSSLSQWRTRLCGLAVVYLLWVSSALGQTPPLVEDRFWILWERVKFFGAHCPAGAQCTEMRSYSSRALDTNNTGFIHRLFGVPDGVRKADPLPNDDPDAPGVCRGGQPELALGFDPLALPRSVKGEVLRGVEALHLDLTPLKPPPGFGGDFGRDLHRQFVERLMLAGIRVVPKDKAAMLAGQPTLNLYFSFSDPEDLCDYEYSVFASLSQEVLLARDLRIKVAAGVWSYSTGSTAKGHSGNEVDAILRVVDQFVQDHREVNSH
ncbi:hypothetical protein NBRC116594_10360 [Shimia sp. NS0008-38b]|uniref:hypothetical protein n=1 Tax=Shimia sp. NS0008-38b TaxID=3127653 RepID=UPI0031040189